MKTLYFLFTLINNQLVFLTIKIISASPIKPNYLMSFIKSFMVSKLSDHYIQVDNEKKEFANQNLTQNWCLYSGIYLKSLLEQII